MKSFKSIREGNSVEPGVSEIDDVQDDPLSFVEIKPKKSKVVKEDLQEAVSVKKEKHSWGTMMTVHHGSDTSYPLHPEHQSAIKKLRPGMKTTFKDETNSTVHAHREGDTVHLTRPKTGSTLTSLPYHHFDTSEHAKPTAKKPAGEYDRKVTDHLKKKYNEEAIIEAHTEDDIANGGTIIYKHDGKHYMAKVSHKTGGGAATKIHTTSKLGHVVSLNHVVSTDASDWNRFKNIKEETEQVDEAQMSNMEIQHAVNLHSMLKNNNPNMAHRNTLKNAHISMVKKHGTSWRKKAGILEDTENMVETKGAPKGFHFTKDGKLKRGDANQDGNGGPMLRADPLDKQRNKVPAVSENAEIEEGIKSKIAGVALSALAAHGAAHGRVTPDGQGGFTGGFKASPTVTAPASAPAAEAPKGFSREYLQGVVDGKHPRPLLSKEKAAEHLKNMKEESEQMDEKLTSKDIKMAVGVAKDKRYAGGNMSGAVKAMEKMKPGLSKHPRVQQVLKSTNEGIDFLKIWNNIKPVHEEVKTTHEDPLVLTKDAEGSIHTHANLSVANAIHGTDVKHQAIHSGKPVQAGKFTFELSKHHEGALKEDAPFDPVAHKKEHDRLMGKHIEAHKAVSKAFADMKAQGKSPRFDIPENEKLNDIKQEIATHNAKIPRGPAPAPGSAAHYYASKKPGEYTGD